MSDFKDNFKEYLKQFNKKIDGVNRKIYHTYRVAENCKKISEKLNLTLEKIELSEFIGIYHDIARFEQYTKYNTFNDLISFDHGNRAIEILKENEFIDKYTNDLNIKRIIEKAIINHNKYKIEDGLKKEEIMFSNIIRDADKIDILFEMKKFVDINKEKIENGTISESIIQDIELQRLVQRKKEMNELEKLLVHYGFIFDFNFYFSFEILNEQISIIEILNDLKFKNKETEKQMAKIKEIILEYINTKYINII